MTEQSNNSRLWIAGIVLLATSLLEFNLSAQGQNQYPGALTLFVLVISIVMFAATYQRSK